MKNYWQVLTSGTDQIGNALNISSRASNQRSTSVENSLGGGSDTSTVNFQAGHVNLPVGLSSQRDVSEVTPEMGRVHTTNEKLTILANVVEVKSKDWLVNLLFRHEGIEDRGHATHRDGREAHANQTVKLTKEVSQTKTRCIIDLGKSVTSLEATQVNNIFIEPAGDRTRAIFDAEDAAIGPVGRRPCLVIARMAAARGTVGSGNPGVRATSIKNHVEILRGSSEGNLTIVLSLRELVDNNAASTTETTSSVGMFRHQAAQDTTRLQEQKYLN